MSTIRRNRNILLFFLLLSALPIYRALIGGEAIGAFDQVAGMGWSPKAAAPTTPWDVLQADSVLQFYVWRDLVLQSWGHGQPAYWNAYELFGTPLMANSQSAVFYPPHIVLGLLHVPTALAMALLAWFHLALAGLGVAWLSRQFGASRLGATVGGAAFATSAFMVAWTALPSVISTVAWIPWVLAFAVKCSRSEGSKLHFLGLAASVGMMILAGHLQFVAYGVMAFAVVVLSVAASEKLWKASWRAVVGLVLGVCLAAPQLLPVLSYSQFSHRRGAPTEQGYSDYVGNAIQPFELATVAFPELAGDPQKPLNEEKDVALSAYWPQYFKRGGNFAEGAIGFGVVALFGLCFLGFAVGRKEVKPVSLVAPAVLALIALLLAIGSPLNRLLYFYAPGWSASGSPGRVEALFVLAMCVLGAVGWSRVDVTPGEGNAKWRPYFPFVAAAAALGLSFAYLGALNIKSWIPGQQADFWPTVFAVATQKARMVALLKFAVVGAIVAFAVHDRLQKRWLLAVAALVVAIPGIGSAVRTAEVPALNKDLMAGSERVAIIPGDWGLLQRAKTFMPPNLATLHQIHEVGGYDSLVHRDSVKLIQDINRAGASPDANGNMMFVKASFDEAKLVAAGVSEVWSTKELPGFVDSGHGYFVKKLDGRRLEARFIGSGVHFGKIVREDVQSVDIEVAGIDSLVLHDRHMPGWTATVDGKPLALKDSVWLEAELPPGTTKVQFKCVPPGLSSGLGLFAVAVVCLAGIFVLSRNREERR